MAATTVTSPATQAPLPDGDRVPAVARPRLVALDGLRFGAAVGVLLFHYLVRDSQAWGRPPSEVFPGLGPWLVYAALGPELFFVISGFVILMTAWGRSVPDVAASRVARLYPAYWVSVLLTGALLLWLWPGGKDVTPGQVAVNLTMLQSLVDVGNVDGVYWTLWTELRFYAIVLVLVAVGLTRRRLLVFAAGWPAAALVADAVGPHWLRELLVSGYAPLFAAGMMLYVVFREGHSRVPWALVLANVAASVWVVVPHQLAQQARNTHEAPSAVVLGVLVVACVGLVAAVTLTPLARLRWRWLTVAGSLTYPLYLLHEHWGWWVIVHVRDVVPTWAALGLATGFSLALAAAVHHGVERRIGPPLRRAVRSGLERAGGTARARVAPARDGRAPRPGPVLDRPVRRDVSRSAVRRPVPPAASRS
ncbi:acyltransferase [uncultured Cellulomonas sp.]|uniref:acyltransferase family protein n=1 Tax=uncultured Cellulomonas sp. TaxID=189682 RepID=UPI00260677AA|nr:acyltransferase [uncultured Cellulomonas sp.]